MPGESPRIRTTSLDEGRVMTSEGINRVLARIQSKQRQANDAPETDPRRAEMIDKFLQEAFRGWPRFPLRAFTQQNGWVVVTKEPRLFGLPGLKYKSDSREWFRWSKDFEEKPYAHTR